jgi:hypothetical protein
LYEILGLQQLASMCQLLVRLLSESQCFRLRLVIIGRQTTPDLFKLFDALSLGYLACANGVAVVRDMVCREGESITRSPNNPSSIIEHEHNNPTQDIHMFFRLLNNHTEQSSQLKHNPGRPVSNLNCFLSQVSGDTSPFHVKHVQGQNTDRPWRA